MFMESDTMVLVPPTRLESLLADNSAVCCYHVDNCSRLTSRIVVDVYLLQNG